MPQIDMTPGAHLVPRFVISVTYSKLWNLLAPQQRRREASEMSPYLRNGVLSLGVSHRRLSSWLLVDVAVFVVLGHVCALPVHVQPAP